MDKTVFGIDPAGPVIITDLQQASYHSRANQVAARQTKSTPLASIQISAAPGPCPTRDSLDVDAWPSQHSLASSTNPELDVQVDPEIQLEGGLSNGAEEVARVETRWGHHNVHY